MGNVDDARVDIVPAGNRQTEASVASGAVYAKRSRGDRGDVREVERWGRHPRTRAR
jgi:hypothetical protein